MRLLLLHTDEEKAFLVYTARLLPADLLWDLRQESSMWTVVHALCLAAKHTMMGGCFMLRCLFANECAIDPENTHFASR